MQIETKFNIGDTVFCAETEWAPETSPCPDCIGERAWKAFLPNGEEIKISCPTCRVGYRTTGTIERYRVQGSVQELTIGSVRFDTHGRDVQYMCEETGVGSGTVWDEDHFFRTREEAERALPAMVEAHQKTMDEQAARRLGNRKDAGSRVAYYRKQIRDAKKQIQDAERGLAREAGEAES